MKITLKSFNLGRTHGKTFFVCMGGGGGERSLSKYVTEINVRIILFDL